MSSVVAMMIDGPSASKAKEQMVRCDSGRIVTFSQCNADGLSSPQPEPSADSIGRGAAVLQRPRHQVAEIALDRPIGRAKKRRTRVRRYQPGIEGGRYGHARG
jgi:hypothetical protein